MGILEDYLPIIIPEIALSIFVILLLKTDLYLDWIIRRDRRRIKTIEEWMLYEELQKKKEE